MSRAAAKNTEAVSVADLIKRAGGKPVSVHRSGRKEAKSQGWRPGARTTALVLDGALVDAVQKAITDDKIPERTLSQLVERLIREHRRDALGKSVTVVTSIIGPCGRFILPLEPEITAAFHHAAAKLKADPSELLAEAAHQAILATITRAAAGGKSK